VRRYQILNLRRQVRRGDAARWYPVATFILDDDRQLEEMKGGGNDKPAANIILTSSNCFGIK
jgi:hypothetical protein